MKEGSEGTTARRVDSIERGMAARRVDSIWARPVSSVNVVLSLPLSEL